MRKLRPEHQVVFSGTKQEAALGQSGVCAEDGEELRGDSQSRAPRRCSFLIAAPLCPPQGTLSAGNNSTEVEGKPARPAMQAEPLSSFQTSEQAIEPQQRRNWSEGWSQASSKLGRVRKRKPRVHLERCGHGLGSPSTQKQDRIARVHLAGSEPLPSMLSGCRWSLSGRGWC